MITSVLVAIALVAFAWSLAVGEFPIPFGDVVATLLGQGQPDTDFVVRTLRLPRGLAAVLVGAAFGLSGAIFQRIARNPLASPDIIGVTAGAAACAVLTIVMFDGTANQVTLGALGGAARGRRSRSGCCRTGAGSPATGWCSSASGSPLC